MQDHYLLIMTQDITPKHDDTYCISLWLHLHQTCLRLLHLRITFGVTMQNLRITHQRIEIRTLVMIGNNTIIDVIHSKSCENILTSLDLTTTILKYFSSYYLYGNDRKED